MEAVRGRTANRLGPNDTRWPGHRLVTLPNGLRLIMVSRPGTPTAAVRAYVRAGSRYDVEERLSNPSRRVLGLAHLTEHLLFKGTQTHTQRDVFASIEHLGGALDAGTTKEYATLSAAMPREGLPVALDVVAELLMEPACREEDLWNEKLVVLAEIQRARDQRGVLQDLFAETLWREHPFRHPVHGSLEGLHDLDRGTVATFHRKRYVAGNAVLVVSGDVFHDRVQRLAERTVGRLPSGPEQPPLPVAEPALDAPRRAHLSKDIAQTYILIGVPTVSMAHVDRSALKVIERVLGMGASGRLYQRLREEAGLVYTVRAVTAHYEDAGYFAVDTACDPCNAAQVEQAVFDEWERLRHDGVSDGELDAAKGNYTGTLARHFETNRAVAGIFGVEALLHRVEPFEAALKRIDAVSPDDVTRAARAYLDPERAVTVSVGRS